MFNFLTYFIFKVFIWENRTKFIRHIVIYLLLVKYLLLIIKLIIVIIVN